MTVPPVRQTAVMGPTRELLGFRLREWWREKIGKRGVILFKRLLRFLCTGASVVSSVRLREMVLGSQYPSFPRGILRPWTTCLCLLLEPDCVASYLERVYTCHTADAHEPDNYEHGLRQFLYCKI